ncbi:hypothetical protein [Dyadobacter sp. CY347]|uniref:hypothetical protein n=1 Tax=Dyadobacter sp. CY347 TaxID=2909336 RepID=UPI001F25D8C6|nr:hypothetical protein [Dyadobacter sp. CY347]MCF2489371.1 hypothetical protein [Dyadobacter sp. CY347]
MQEFYKFCDSHILCLPFAADIVSGFLTSFIFLFALLFLFRPRIKIGPQIATHLKSYGEATPNTWYCFKIVNGSLFRAFDLKVEVVQKIPMTGPEGKQNHRTILLRLHKDQYNYVAPFRFGEKSEYALWFMTTDDIAKILNENEHYSVEIRVIAKHELTGLGSVFVRNYSKHDIKNGTFKSGNTFEIVS